MRVSVKFWVIFSALSVAALACGGAGDDATTPTGTVLGLSVTPSTGSPGDAACTPEAYLVQTGDTLSEIALEFDVSAEAIAEASDLSDPDVLEVDRELTIPCPVSEAAPPETTSTPAA